MPTEYNITRTTGRCAACDREMAPGEELVATVRELASGEAIEDQDNGAGDSAGDDRQAQFLREDFCPACWDAGASDEHTRERFGVWRTRVPTPREKKRTFVDDEVLVSFFRRLEGSEDPARASFRFVLALILMRKKVLVYEAARPGENGQDLWCMRFKGGDETCEVIDPHLDEEKIAEVSRQLGEILHGEL